MKLTDAERETLRTSGSWPNVGADIYAAVEAIVAARVQAALTEAAAVLESDHDMPPAKDRRSYAYRMGWWDAAHHAARIVRDMASGKGETICHEFVDAGRCRHSDDEHDALADLAGGEGK